MVTVCELFLFSSVWFTFYLMPCEDVGLLLADTWGVTTFRLAGTLESEGRCKVVFIMAGAYTFWTS